MENKTLLAIVLSVFVIIASQYFLAKQEPPARQPKPPAEKKEEAKQAKPSAPLVTETSPAEEKEIRVDGDLYTAIFSSKGATVKYWEIKRYKDKMAKDVVLLATPGPMPALGMGAD